MEALIFTNQGFFGRFYFKLFCVG